MGKPVTLHRQARRDIEDGVDYYRTMASEEAAFRFVDALEDAADQIREFPGAGSPQLGRTADVSGLRTRRVRGFPYTIFYVEHEAQIEVMRVIHSARDLSAQLSELLDDESE